MTVLDHLVEEHRKAEQLVAQLAATTPGKSRTSILAELSDALDLHMEVEERDIYPIVQQHLGAGRADSAEQEHNETRELLAQLADGLDDPDFGAIVESLSAALHHHVTEEEHEIFPALRSRAGAEVEALGDPEQVEDEVEEQLAEEAPSAK